MSSFKMPLARPHEVPLTEIRRLYEHRNQFEQAVEKIRHKAEHLLALVELYDQYLDEFKRIDLWYEGIPIWSDDRYITTPMGLDMGFNRNARIYKNAVHKRKWGLNICGDGCGQGGTNCGFYWPRLKDVREAALRWVALGEKPLYNGKEEME